MRTKRRNANLFEEIIVDGFAGGGGASHGIESAVGRCVDVAWNHDREAIEMHERNHPHTWHLCEDGWQIDPEQATGGRPVGLAWFSPDCKHFSRAKGSKPVSKKIRGLAWIVIKWAKPVRPRVIMLENVREFETWGPLGADNRPCPLRAGITFRRWLNSLTNLGYVVEKRVLNAADYGAPTHRRRLFLIARCDGQPIRWPEPTHGPGRPRPWRTAAECIDWSLPCPSIFERKKPLAEKTLRRIAMGIKRYVIDNPRPFIVQVNHGGNEFRGQEINRPLTTISAKHGFGVVVPSLVECANSNWGNGTRPADAPAPTVTANPKGGSWALVSAFLAKHYGGVVGHEPTRPLGTITAKDHHSVVAANLVHLNHGGKQVSACNEPMRTVVASGGHAALVYSFMIKYYGVGIGQACNEPLHTVVSRDRFGLVTVNVDGTPYVINDIGLRMLTPRELARAQGFPDSYVLTGTKSSQVARIGNSVCPPIAEALVRANYVESERKSVVA